MDNAANHSGLPDWLIIKNPSPPKPAEAPGLPDWLTVPEPRAPKKSQQAKDLQFTQYDVIFPRVLELIYEGYTLAKALRELPYEINAGAFTRWVNANPKYKELYREAKEIRTEAWAGKIIQHAEGVDDDGNGTMEEVQRSKLIVDSLKWLMAADHRKQYGDTKTIDVSMGISITDAIAQARTRIAGPVIDAEFEEVRRPALLDEGDDDDE